MGNTARLVAIACLMLVAGVTRVDAQPEPDFASANYLLPGCRDYLAERYDEPRPLIFRQGICAGQVAGVWDAAATLHAVCSPGDANLNQGMRLVALFIDAHPTRMQEQLTALALEALVAAWPCK